MTNPPKRGELVQCNTVGVAAPVVCAASVLQYAAMNAPAEVPTPTPSRKLPRILRILGIAVGSVVLVLAILVGVARNAMTSDTHLVVGGTAPDFTLLDQTGAEVTLSTVLQTHRGAIVAFYPKDFTPG